MKIEHLAIWTEDIELMRQFYVSYFNLTSSDKYINTTKNYRSYFLSFGDGKTRIELMYIPNMDNPANRGNLKGLAHFAISVGGRKEVDDLTDRFLKDGFTIASQPRTTGDGYYESVILDPEGNRIEITE